jgi:hypothetical protein
VSLPGNVKKRVVDLALPLFQESEDEKLLVEQLGREMQRTCHVMYNIVQYNHLDSAGLSFKYVCI